MIGLACILADEGKYGYDFLQYNFTSTDTAPEMEPWNEVYQKQKKSSLLTY